MRMGKTTVSIIVIVLFHVVGLIGFLVPAFQPLFLKLVPFHLLLMLAVIIVNHYRLNENFWLFAFLVFMAGIVAEWIGVHKHWLFGDYEYGQTLGTKVFDIPLLIGVNWFLLVYTTGVALQRSRLKSITGRIVIGAIILVLLDLLIEPVAVRFNYWHWADGIISLKNYICWFGLSAAFLFVFEQFQFKKQSIVAVALLVSQFVFFGVLQLA